MTGTRQFWKFLSTTRRALLAAAVLCLSGCGFLVTASAKDRVSVNVHGVNYTGNEFTYVLIDPDNPANTAGGELVEPFAAGGTMCCFDLPKTWAPGMRVQVRTTNFLVAKTDKSLSEVRNTYTVEVPPYTNGKAVELWVIRTAAGDIELVSSDYQPDHEKWPGAVRGWPVPSIEYRRSRWEIYRKTQRGFVDTYEQLILRLDKDPQKAISEAWEVDSKYSSNDVKKFAGPSDPNYLLWLKQKYSAGLERAVQRLKEIEEKRP